MASPSREIRAALIGGSVCSGKGRSCTHTSIGLSGFEPFFVPRAPLLVEEELELETLAFSSRSWCPPVSYRNYRIEHAEVCGALRIPWLPNL